MYVFSTSFILMYNCQLPKYNCAQKLHVEMGDKVALREYYYGTPVQHEVQGTVRTFVHWI